MGAESYLKNVEKGLIEVAPLAYMRGRTLDNSFIILDEAQNTTPAQMKMFLTRIGFGSKVIVTGDLTQKDLPRGVKSGLEHAVEVLSFVPEDDGLHPGLSYKQIRYLLLSIILLRHVPDRTLHLWYKRSYQLMMNMRNDRKDKSRYRRLKRIRETLNITRRTGYKRKKDSI